MVYSEVARRRHSRTRLGCNGAWERGGDDDDDEDDDSSRIIKSLMCRIGRVSKLPDPWVGKLSWTAAEKRARTQFSGAAAALTPRDAC